MFYGLGDGHSFWGTTNQLTTAYPLMILDEINYYYGCQIVIFVTPSFLL